MEIDEIDRKLIIICILMSWMQISCRRIAARRNNMMNLIKQQAIRRRNMRERQDRELLDLMIGLSNLLLSVVLPTR